MAFSTLTASIAALAAAQAPQAQPVAPVVASITKCRSVADEQARLRCYDSAAAALDTATASGSLVVLDRDAVKKTRRSLFGFDIPNLPFFRGNDDVDSPKEIQAKVTAARAAGFENWVLTLDNGAVWQTTEPTPKLSMPRVGDDIKVKRSVTGTYMVQVGSRNIRARRVR